MRLMIELTPGQGEQLRAAAQAEGVDLAALAQKLVAEHLPTMPVAAPTPSAPEISAKNRAAIAMLQGWMAEDATDDPEEIRRAEEELAELKRNLNANRAASAETLVFP
jgi:hypothetical protein